MKTDPVILHVSSARTWRGGEQQLAYLASELRDMGIHQYVLCVKGSAVETFCIHAHIPYFTTGKRSSVDFLFGKRIASICKKNNVDIVHTHDSHSHTFAIFAADLFGNTSRIVVSRRVDFPGGGSFFSRYKYNHRKVSMIICVSEKIMEITSEVIRNKNGITTIHSGIDLERFRGKNPTGKLHDEFGLGAGTRIIANVAALAPHKDYHTFVDAAAIICRKRDDVFFLIIGDGPMKKEITEYIIKSGFSSRIILTGFRLDVADMLPEVDIFLITSETEGLGTSILDAFACKVPVVATSAGGIPELVINEKTGLLNPVKDPVSIALSVEKLLDDQELAASVVSGATQHLESFTTNATAAKTLAVYREVFNSHQ